MWKRWRTCERERESAVLVRGKTHDILVRQIGLVVDHLLVSLPTPDALDLLARNVIWSNRIVSQAGQRRPYIPLTPLARLEQHLCPALGLVRVLVRHLVRLEPIVDLLFVVVGRGLAIAPDAETLVRVGAAAAAARLGPAARLALDAGDDGVLLLRLGAKVRVRVGRARARRLERCGRFGGFRA